MRWLITQTEAISDSTSTSRNSGRHAACSFNAICFCQLRSVFKSVAVNSEFGRPIRSNFPVNLRDSEACPSNSANLRLEDPALMVNNLSDGPWLVMLVLSIYFDVLAS